MKIQHVPAKILAILAFTLTAVGIFVYLFGMAGGRVGTTAPYRLFVTVPTAGQLVPNADVRRAGIKVGRVAEIRGEGRYARLRLELDPQVVPVRRDATVRVRMKTLVGENYVDLDPGTPRAGTMKSGAVLGVDHAQEAVQLDEILSAVDPKTRRAVRRNLDASGLALGGRGADVNAVLGELRGTTESAGGLLRIVAERRAQVAALLGQAGDVMHAFGARSTQLQSLVTDLRQVTGTMADRDRAVRETVREIPATLRTARTSVMALGRLATRSTPVVRNVRLANGDLHALVRDLRPTAVVARRAVGDLVPALDAADPLLQRLAPFGTELAPALDGLRGLLREAGPIVTFLRTYSREFGAFFANAGAGVTSMDSVGNLGRVHLIFSESSLVLWTPELRQIYNALLDTTGLSKFHREGLNFYPAPGTIGKPQDPSGDYPRIAPGP